MLYGETPFVLDLVLNLPPRVLGSLGLAKAITSSSSYIFAQFGRSNDRDPLPWALCLSWMAVHDSSAFSRFGWGFGSFHRALA